MDTATHVRGRTDGELAARRVGAAGWFAGGFVSSVFPVLGTAALWVVAGVPEVHVPADRTRQIAGESSIYQQAFAKGFARKAISKRRRSVLIGGLLSTTILAIGFFATTGGSTY
jgi:hypothetical protein